MHRLIIQTLLVEQPAARENERKHYLDGLRGVAACVVFFGHLAIALSSPLTHLWNGNSAVCIFFVLRSYVLSDLAQHSRLSFLAQVLRRYIRLVVPMLLTSTFAWALLAAGLYYNQAAAELTQSPWLGRWYKFEPSFAAMVIETFHGIFVGGSSAYNPNLWTMRPELFGSVCIFLINAIVAKRQLRAVCYVGFAILYLDDYLPLFSVGALLYEFIRSSHRGSQNSGIEPFGLKDCVFPLDAISASCLP